MRSICPYAGTVPLSTPIGADHCHDYTRLTQHTGVGAAGVSGRLALNKTYGIQRRLVLQGFGKRAQGVEDVHGPREHLPVQRWAALSLQKEIGLKEEQEQAFKKE